MTAAERAWITLQCRMAQDAICKDKPIRATQILFGIIDKLEADNPDAPDDDSTDTDDDAHNCPRGERRPKMPTVGDL